MHSHHTLPDVLGQFDERPAAGDARVADQDVDLAEGLDHLGDQRLDLVVIRDVGHFRHRLTAQAADLARRRFGGFAIDVGDGDVRARLRIAQGDRLADSAARSGYQCHLALKFHACLSPIDG